MKNTLLFIVVLFFGTLHSSAQSSLPTGSLDFADQYSGYGWAYDPDALILPIDVHIYIDGRLYDIVTANENRPDLVTGGVTPDPYHGFSFSISGFDLTRAHEIIVFAINYGGGPNPALTNCPARVGVIPLGEAVISNVAGPSNITITTTQRLAGAIGSLTWNGREFIDSYDHGRELQSATSFNNWGECFNPTEAGSNQDGTGNTSTSFLQYISTTANYLETQTLPAFWTQPGLIAPGCGAALNTMQRSSHYFHKKVTIGMPGMAHVIQYLTEFDIPYPESYTSGTFEVVTAYMPPDMSVFWNYNPANQQLTSLSDDPVEQELPIIFSTVDQNYAMGIYTPDLPDNSFPNHGYGRFRYPSCTKWNCVFRESPVTAGTYKYRSYVIVGSLQNVQNSMTQLYNFFTITADFSPDTVCAGVSFTFTSLSTGANSDTRYQWDIYDNGSIDDSASNFTYIFDSPGTYPVRLTAINGVAAAHQSSIVKNVVVIAPPDAGNIAGSTNVCEGSHQIYSIASIPYATLYEWSLPTGWEGSSDSSAITITAGANGGNIGVTVSNPWCSGVPSSIDITVKPAPLTPVISYDLIVLSSDALLGNQWYYENEIIPGAILPVHTPLLSGHYFVIVTGTNGCPSDTSNIIYVGLSGMNDFPTKNDIYNLYPVPAVEYIYIQKNSVNDDLNTAVLIYNAQGQLLLKQQLLKNLTQIDISKFAEGLYFVKFETSDEFVIKKFIKQLSPSHFKKH
ncbi:MAG: T9SS type A sorting domain-containing protein [Bacteroidales bacterium]|nr:T9SS type A sorting domain-containing protein [Bacteroidales bacterium]MDD4214069.1 T9SS type A sorting domain-containing protein [Bacteroidales bacterium]